MNYNRSTRKNISSVIIEKANEIDRDYEGYASRLNDTAEAICSPNEKDFKEREILVDYIDTYKDTYNELKHINRYKLKEEVDLSGNEISGSAVSYLDTINIDVKKYIPHWNDIINSNYCGKGNNIPMIIKDCKKIWSIFYEYYRNMPKDKIKDNDLWKENKKEMRVTNDDEAVPYFPSVNSFSNCIVTSEDQSEETMPIMEIIQNLNNIKKVFFKDNDYVKQEYVMDNLMTINERNDKIRRSLRDGTFKTYSKNIIIKSNEYLDDKKQEENGTTTYNFTKEIIKSFENIDYLYLYNDNDNNNFAIAKKNSIERKKREKKIIDPGQPGPDGQPGPPVITYKYYYYVIMNLDIVGSRIGTSSLKIYSGNLEPKINNILNYYLVKLKGKINSCIEAYNNTNVNIRNDDYEPKKNYDYFLKIVDKYINNESYGYYKVNEIIDTINNVFTNWFKKRETALLKVVRDKDIPEGMKSILTNRMNKNNGTLFSWYAQQSIPMVNDYTRIEEKNKNSMYVFKTGILAKPDAGLDYTQDDNGGKKLINPSFIDVPDENFKYYKKSGITSEFKTGDEVYVLDDINPEMKCKITSIDRWKAVIGTYEDENGEQQKKRGFVKRMNLDITIPTDAIKYNSLRIVKRI